MQSQQDVVPTTILQGLGNVLKLQHNTALALLDQAETCDLPLFPALRAAALAGSGKKAAARQELAE